MGTPSASARSQMTQYFGQIEVLAVGVAVYHGALEPELLYRSFELIGSRFRIMRRQRSKTGKPAGILPDDSACSSFILFASEIALAASGNPWMPGEPVESTCIVTPTSSISGRRHFSKSGNLGHTFGEFLGSMVRGKPVLATHSVRHFTMLWLAQCSSCTDFLYLFRALFD